MTHYKLKEAFEKAAELLHGRLPSDDEREYESAEVGEMRSFFYQQNVYGWLMTTEDSVGFFLRDRRRQKRLEKIFIETLTPYKSLI